MSKPVAVKGDVKATAASGWKVVDGTLVETPHSQLTVGNVPVLSGAQCMFTDTSSGTTVTVVLTAGSTILQVSTTAPPTTFHVLVDGDTTTTSGNTLTVSATGKLKTD
jgi:hypothetical protein